MYRGRYRVSGVFQSVSGAFRDMPEALRVSGSFHLIDFRNVSEVFLEVGIIDVKGFKLKGCSRGSQRVLGAVPEVLQGAQRVLGSFMRFPGYFRSVPGSFKRFQGLPGV